MSSSRKRQTASRKLSVRTADYWAEMYRRMKSSYDETRQLAVGHVNRLNVILQQGKTLGLPVTKPEEVVPMLMQAAQEEVHQWRSAMQAIAALCDRTGLGESGGDLLGLVAAIAKIANEKVKS